MANESEFTNSDSLPDFVSDCRLMLRFARKNGTDLSPEMEHEIAQLDSILTELNLPPVSDIPRVLVSDSRLSARDGPPIERPPTDAAVAPSKSSSELMLRVHGELSKVIAPATALSLQTTEPPPGRHTFFGGMPLVVKAAALAALICAGGFVISAGFIAAKAARDTQQKVEADKNTEQAKKAEEKKKRADSEGEKK